MKRSALARSDRKRPLLGKAIPAEGRLEKPPRPRKALQRSTVGIGSSSVLRAADRRRKAEKSSRVQPSAAFRREVRKAPCAICGTTAVRRDPHHLLSQESVRVYVRSLRLPEAEARVLLRRLLSDQRGGVALCRPDHEAVENRSLPFPRSKIPLVAWQMAAELGEWATVRLEREYLETKMPLAPGPL